MKKILLITISLSIAYWGVLLAVEYSWTLPIPFLVIAYMWYCFLMPNYKIVCKDEKYGILRTSDNYMMGISFNASWWLDEDMQDKFCYTTDKEKVERFLEQLNSN
jgi:hypothetical protein